MLVLRIFKSVFLIFAFTVFTIQYFLMPSSVSSLRAKPIMNISRDIESNSTSISDAYDSSRKAFLSLSLIDEPKKQTLFKSTQFTNVLDSNASLPPLDELIKEPALTFPFELDTFQKQAILCVESKKDVFVAAHTSAGKTAVAEYAIALSILKNLSRVVYTSPIKALSNQKFRDFGLKFEAKMIGILTGDVQLNTEAPCLIMTTEILLQMLYRKSPLISEIEWVIFDEVHYVNNPERGHVWEEIFIMLPDHINMLLLSATVPNVIEFTDWLGQTRNKLINVVYTTKRSVPLEHYLYTGSNGKTINEKFLFIDKNGKLLTEGYRKALMTKKERESLHSKNFGPLQKKVNPTQEKNIYITVIRHLKNMDKLPVIIFTFSRNRCNENAFKISSSLELTTSRERGTIHKFIHKSLLKLKKIDRDLPQIKSLTAILKNGFGIHHSGILPLLKEITEILFQKGLVRVLFATETFSMGINMPTRTVLFDSIYKHDGLQFRNLQPSEYIQMAGRAGRRGIDETGHVIILCKGDVPELSELSKIAAGKATPLESQFRLTYSMLLNIHRSSETIRVEHIMERSFTEKNRLASIKSKSLILREKSSDIPKIDCHLCNDLDFLVSIWDEYCASRSIMKSLVGKCSKVIGNCVIWHGEEIWCVGVVIGVKGESIDVIGGSWSKIKEILKNKENYFQENSSEEKRNDFIENFNSHDIPSCFFEFQTVQLISVHSFLKKSIDFDYLALIRNEDTKQTISLLFSLLSFLFSFSDLVELFSFPVFDAITDFNMRLLEESIKFDKMKSLRTRIMSSRCLKCPMFFKHFSIEYKRSILLKSEKAFDFANSHQSLQYYPEYKWRMQVLEALGYISNDALELKGKAACCISENELMITELLVDNILGDLSIEHMAAVLSCFVYKGRGEEKGDETLVKAIDKIKEISERIDSIESYYSGLPQKNFQESLNFGLVEVVFNWAKGLNFAKILELTDVQEGIIVRTIQRLDELLKDVKEASMVLGNQDLIKKMEETSECIRRDIVFVASLYLENEVTVDETEEDYDIENMLI